GVLAALAADVAAGLGERGVDLGAVLLLGDKARLLGRRGAVDGGQRRVGHRAARDGRGGQLLGRNGGLDVVLVHRDAGVGAALGLELRGLGLEVGAVLVGARLGLALHLQLGRRASIGGDVGCGRRQLVERARHLLCLCVRHARGGLVGGAAAGAAAAPRAEPRRDRLRDVGDDLARGLLLLRGLALLGLLVGLAARHLALDGVIGQLLGGLGLRAAGGCFVLGLGALGRRRPARAHLLGRVGLLLGAQLADVGAGRGVQLSERRTELVGPHALQLREPDLGLGACDAGRRLLRLGRSAPAGDTRFAAAGLAGDGIAGGGD